MKSIFNTITLYVIPAWLCLQTAVIAQEQSIEAGRYWLNVVQTGQSSYLINLTIAAGQALEVRTVRVPTIIDFSEIPTVDEVSSGSETKIDYPVKFTSEGQDSLWIAVHDAADPDKVSYIVFELFNEVTGDTVRGEVESVSNRWRAFGGSESVMQFGRTAANCGDNLSAAADDSGIFTAQNAVSGVMLLGTAKQLESGIGSFSSTGWGLKYLAEKKLRVGTFYRVRELHAGQVEADQPVAGQVVADQSVAGQEGGDERSGQRSDSSGNRETVEDSSGDTNNRSDSITRERSNSSDPGKGKSQPASGPYSGVGTSARIVNLAVNKTWAPDKQGAGHFGETLVNLPLNPASLKSIEKIELTLRIRPRAAGPGKGRIFISTKRTLPSGPSGGDGSFWFADRFDQQGYFLGEFDTEFGSPDYRFDITDWAGANRANAYYVSILNLSRVPLDIEDISLNLSGVR